MILFCLCIIQTCLALVGKEDHHRFLGYLVGCLTWLMGMCCWDIHVVLYLRQIWGLTQVSEMAFGGLERNRTVATRCWAKGEEDERRRQASRRPCHAVCRCRCPHHQNVRAISAMLRAMDWRKQSKARSLFASPRSVPGWMDGCLCYLVHACLCAVLAPRSVCLLIHPLSTVMLWFAFGRHLDLLISQRMGFCPRLRSLAGIARFASTTRSGSSSSQPAVSLRVAVGIRSPFFTPLLITI